MKINATANAAGGFTANPRFYDRLNAVCTAILAGGLVVLAVMAATPQPGPMLPDEAMSNSIASGSGTELEKEG